MSAPLMNVVHAFACHEEPPHIAAALRPRSLERWHPLVHIHHIVSSIVAPGRLGFTACDVGVVRAAVLQCLYSFTCNQQLMEHLRYNTLYRWFVGLSDGENPWSAVGYAEALNRLGNHEDGARVLREVMIRAHASASLSPDQFHIDGAMFERCTAGTDAEEPIGALPSDAEELCLARLDRARAIILRRIGDETLTADGIASEMCMSRRALFLLFEKHGLTPTRVIRDLRLDHCRRLLLDARHRRRKITDIAMDFGFGNPGTFSRRFKDRFGISPIELRFAERGKSPAIRNNCFLELLDAPAST